MHGASVIPSQQNARPQRAIRLAEAGAPGGAPGPGDMGLPTLFTRTGSAHCKRGESPSSFPGVHRVAAMFKRVLLNGLPAASLPCRGVIHSPRSRWNPASPPGGGCAPKEVQVNGSPWPGRGG